MKRSIIKHPAQLQYLIAEILHICGDKKSARFYRRVAQAIPDHVIFRFLSEIKDDETIKNRGAVFTSKVKRYVSRHNLQI